MSSSSLLSSPPQICQSGLSLTIAENTSWLVLQRRMEREALCFRGSGCHNVGLAVTLGLAGSMITSFP